MSHNWRKQTLCKRIIPTILCRGYNVVKGRQFSADRVVGNVKQTVEVYNMRWVDELVVFDVEARKEGRCIRPDFVSEIASINFIPLTVGGGIVNSDEARGLIQAGADKVAIGYQPQFSYLVREIADDMGSQAIVACINYLDEREALDAAKSAQKSGAGEIILQSIMKDGMMTGYDLQTAFHVSASIDIPVVLSCGAGTYEHLYQGLQVADAVAAGAMWTFTDSTPREAKKYLKERGVEVRVV